MGRSRLDPVPRRAPSKRRGGVVAFNVLTLAHLYPNAARPGAGPFVKDEVAELAKRHTFAVVSPMRWLPPLPLEPVRRERAVPFLATESGIRVMRPRVPALPFGGLAVESRLWAGRLAPLLRRSYLELGGDLIHAHFAIPDGFAAASFASRAQLPLVITLYGSDVMDYGRRRSLRPLLRQAFAEARAIIAVSQEIADRAEQLGASVERLRVIPCGVPYREPVPRAAAREALGLPDSVACLVWVGGLVPVKQPLDALEAFERLSAEGTHDARMVVIGDGPLRGEVCEFVRRRNLEERVRLVGHCTREQVWSWQCAADLLVNSSRSEGTPLAVLESLGAGTPVVAYDVGGIDAVVSAVSGGTISPEATPAALAAAIASEFETHRDRERLALEARALFDITRTARAIEEVYEAIA